MFKWKFENAAKVRGGLKDNMVFTNIWLGFDQGLPKGGIELIKRVISDYWLGFRGDDPS
jgi:hypothetical protein